MDQLHKPARRNFIRRRIITNGIDEIFAADLVEMEKFSKWNKGIRYLLMIIDTFSKFRWIFPLRDKTVKSVANAFEQLLQIGKGSKDVAL